MWNSESNEKKLKKKMYTQIQIKANLKPFGIEACLGSEIKHSEASPTTVRICLSAIVTN